jgi:hypothetical protein
MKRTRQPRPRVPFIARSSREGPSGNFYLVVSESLRREPAVARAFRSRRRLIDEVSKIFLC